VRQGHNSRGEYMRVQRFRMRCQEDGVPDGNYEMPGAGLGEKAGQAVAGVVTMLNGCLSTRLGTVVKGLSRSSFR
jgi:hypothetical protein